MPSVDVEKKRKRASDRHERPSKKPALELQDLPPLASSVVEDHNELAPVIAITPGVVPPRNLQLTPYIKSRDEESASSRKHSHHNRGIASKEVLLQSSEHPKLDFLGREAEDQTDAQLKHYVAVVDPEQKTWQFVEVRKITLRGGIRRYKPTDDDEEEAEEEMQTMRAQRNALTNTFGTKQSRKAVQSMAENAQLSNAPTGIANAAESAILSSMPVESLDMASKAASVQATVQAAKPIPAANLAATHPSDVYPIEVLVPNGVSTLRQLPGVQEWRDRVLSGQGVSTGSRYVSNRVDAVVRSGNTTHLQVLRFILLLLEFNRALRAGPRGDSAKSAGPGSKRLPPREELRRIFSTSTGVANTSKAAAAEQLEYDSSSSSVIPDSVIDAIRRKFAPQGSLLTKFDVTLLHTTICALTLHIPPQPAKDGGSSTQGGNSPNELATDPADLRDDLRVDSATAAQYYRELGCRVDKPRESEHAKFGIKGGKAEANTKRIARLRVPVEFPKVSRGGAKR
ncbi:hypothetical protein ASPZODRAFT_129165 [Penicilliopsis zonata CBS 506.65]|uniref:DNA-directed RNA polymerase I subunit RPA49 n=1 Tax=Penicilliopsis zonata CBS 506.65 TaxID=1073090 RepID=A0A1L9SP15_9EURO|nr:hypothetical protein ASPZODRAFT_129165 [Penicilliopsis zonata CBS 506.65]OJJ48843.1 hypothetical protein ASPZODRAFT_129165 [Penicilliopsis zonata CBS 506.65]